MNRRHFITSLLSGAAALTFDPERLFLSHRSLALRICRYREIFCYELHFEDKEHLFVSRDGDDWMEIEVGSPFDLTKQDQVLEGSEV